MNDSRGVLVLADGTVFEGTLSGARRPVDGNVGFITGMTGYLEALTDPCSSGMLLCFTYPSIGNYGVNPAHGLSSKAHARGIIVREACPWPSHFETELNLQAYLMQQGITMLEDVDTRALTRHIRLQGVQRGVIMADDGSNSIVLPEQLYEEPVFGGELPSVERFPGGATTIAVLNLGAVDRLVQDLRQEGYTVLLFPDTAEPREILAENPAALVLSEGAEVPRFQNEHPIYLDHIRRLAEDLPIVGLGVGHLLLAEAFGARVAQMPQGHRGANHPVRKQGYARIEMTRQNHGYVVVRDSFDERVFAISHSELHDQSIEGLKHLYLPLRSLQYYSQEWVGILKELLTTSKEAN